MIHNVNELYKVKRATAVAFVYDYYSADCAPKGAKRVSCHSGKTMRVHQADGSVRIAYFYGEKTWSYDQEELEAYRAQCNAEYEELKRRNRALKALNEYLQTLSTEELEEKIAVLNLKK